MCVAAEVTRIQFFLFANYTDEVENDASRQLMLTDMLYVQTDGSSSGGVTAEWFCNDAFSNPTADPTFTGASSVNRCSLCVNVSQ